jgi:hypothetical protein
MLDVEFRLRHYAAYNVLSQSVWLVVVRDFSPCRMKDIHELNLLDEELLLIYVQSLFAPVKVCTVLTLSS